MDKIASFAAETAAKIFAECNRKPDVQVAEGLTLAKLQAANEILNAAKMPSEVWNGYEFVKCPPVARKVRWRMFPQFFI